MDRLDDSDWSRPNMKQVSRGISALGATNVLSAFLSGIFIGLSSTNIGLAFATGITSRIVGIVAGAVLIAASFFPKLTTIELFHRGRRRTGPITHDVIAPLWPLSQCGTE